MKLKDQVAIVTGAGRNIGEETSKLLASEGAKVAVADMDKARADKVATDIVKAGGDSGIYSTLFKVYIGMPATTVRVRGRG